MIRLNNRNIGTDTHLLKIAPMLCSYVVELIDGTLDLSDYEYEDEFKRISQKLKRLLYYNTKSPFADVSTKLNNEIVEQPNVEKSLVIKKVDNIEKNCIYNGLINLDVKMYEKSLCFIYDVKTHAIDEVNGRVTLRIDLVCADNYDTIIDVDYSDDIKTKRGSHFLYLLNLLLDRHVIENKEYADVIGNVKFVFEDSFKERVSDTNGDMKYSIVYSVMVNNLRGENYD